MIIGKIFEGVEKLQFVQKESTRQAFLDNMITIALRGCFLHQSDHRHEKRTVRLSTI